MDFYSSMYEKFKDAPNFKSFVARKILKHPMMLFDYFF
jgi:hypothetical protein